MHVGSLKHQISTSMYPQHYRILLVWVALFTTIMRAADTDQTGVIEGRIFNTESKEFLNKARVTVDGTALETFSDATGEYRLTGVPEGTARVKVFYTGI